MKIAVISPDFPPTTGGEAEYGFQMATELAKRSHEVTVFTRLKNTFASDSFSVRAVLHGNDRIDSKQMDQLRGFDIVHTVNATWSWVVRLGVPTIASAYGNDFIAPNRVVRFNLKSRLGLRKGDRLDYWLSGKSTVSAMRKSLPKCGRIFCCSGYTESKLLEKFPRCGGLTEVAWPGVSQRFSLTGTNQSAGNSSVKRLLTVCRLSEKRKNVDLVIRALASLKSQYSFHYTIVGEGSLRPQLESLANDVGLVDHVTFAGRVSDDELASHYANADLFVLPSGVSDQSFEGFGIVYLEANAMGVPTMAVRVGGAQEAVDEGRSGFFVESPTIDAIKDGIDRFLRGQFTFCRKECESFARQFTWSRVADQFELAYRASLGKTGA